MEHQHAEHVAASPERLFSALADVGNLPHYVPQMRSAQATSGDRVEVEARYDGHDQHGEGWFRADADSHTIEWGAGSESSYHGRLAITPDGEGSMLSLALTTPHEIPDEDIAGTLDAIRRLAESEI